MDATIRSVALLVRSADRAGRWQPAIPGIVPALLVVLVLAFAGGALVADLLTQDPEAVLAAPFRWRER